MSDNEIIKKYFSTIGKIGAAKRWGNHTKQTDEEKKIYRREKMREVMRERRAKGRMKDE